MSSVKSHIGLDSNQSFESKFHKILSAIVMQIKSNVLNEIPEDHREMDMNYNEDSKVSSLIYPEDNHQDQYRSLPPLINTTKKWRKETAAFKYIREGDFGIVWQNAIVFGFGHLMYLFGNFQ